MNSFNKFFLLICLFLSHSKVFCQELSDEQIGDPALFEKTFPWKDTKQMAMDPTFNSNIYFANQEMFAALSNPETNYVYGMGDKENMVVSTNFVANTTMAAAKTDPRGLEFIDQSLIKSVSNLSQESEGMAELEKMQLGDSTQRFMQAEVIEPNIGVFQTADNEQAFQSAYDNLMLGKAEQALYEGDRISATNQFESQAKAFQGDTDKQMNASEFQREGILRSKQTAETFRDFFSYKSDVTSNNLALMPTPESLLANCRRNTPSGEDLLGVYNVAISQSERDFYKLTPPNYSNIDFCESYIHHDEATLIKNLPVHEKLASINEHSLQMAAGLDEVSKTLSNQGLSNAELAAFLDKNAAWNELKGRQQAMEECEKKNCLSVLEAKLDSVVNYKGADQELAPEHKAARVTLSNVIANKKLTPELAGFGASKDFSNISALSSSSSFDSSSGNSFKGTSSSTLGKKLLSSLGAGGPKGSDSLSGPNSGVSAADGAYYKQGNSISGAGLFKRNESGVLVGPSGKPVMGHANPAHLDLFQIISSRYQKRFFKE